MAKKSDTMELDAILAESRSRKGGSSAPKAPAGKAQAPARKPAPARQQRSFNDDFIVTDDDNRTVKQPKASGSPKKPAQKSTQNKNQNKKKKKTGLIVAICIISILLVAAAGGLTLYLFSGSGTGPDSTFSDNVYVNGKSLKDMTMGQAKALMKSVEDEMANGIKIDVKAGDKTYSYTKDDFNYSFDTDQVLSEAKTYSEEKGIKTEDKNYEIKMTVEDTTCPDIITKIAGDVKSDAKDAKVTDFDPDADSMFTIEDETKGVSLDEETSLNALKTFINGGNISGSVDATVKEVDPEITAGYLKENIIKLSSFSTTSTNNSNGNENMRVSLAACNGSIIEPGATWSFNDHTGNSNLESNGYKPAGVIIQGRSETGVGGGICQSSTTIYNACILCGMDVVERQCHYYKSVYVEAGRDATVDYGNIDLKVNNPFKYQLFMKCWMDGVELNCEIWGLENPKFDDIEISTSSPSYFDRGYKVYTTRTYLKDGKEVDSDELPSSTYYTSAPSSGSDNSGGSSYDNDDDGDSSGGSSSGGESSSGSGDSGDSGDSGESGNSGGESGGEGGEGGGESGGESGDSGESGNSGGEGE
ncbi:MAG: VanW family protein [Ruminococcus sp.]|nr:VanW family protein [Ruminococcus sp.]